MYALYILIFIFILIMVCDRNLRITVLAAIISAFAIRQPTYSPPVRAPPRNQFSRYGSADTTEIRVKKHWFEKIADGSKTIEVRLNVTPFNKISPGDTISIVNACEGDPAITAHVKSVHTYASIDEFAQNVDGARLFPGAEDVTEVLKEFYNQGAESGLIAIDFEIDNVVDGGNDIEVTW